MVLLPLAKTIRDGEKPALFAAGTPPIPQSKEVHSGLNSSHHKLIVPNGAAKKRKRLYTIQESYPVVNARFWPLRFDGGLASPQRLEKIDQRSSFTRAQLYKQADGFQQATSGLLIVAVWPALFTLTAIVFPDTILAAQRPYLSGHRTVDLSAIVSVRQHLGQTLGANWSVGVVWPLFYRGFRTVIDGSQCRGREFDPPPLHFEGLLSAIDSRPLLLS